MRPLFVNIGERTNVTGSAPFSANWSPPAIIPPRWPSPASRWRPARKCLVSTWTGACWTRWRPCALPQSVSPPSRTSPACRS